MYKVVLASRNKNKIREFGELLCGLSDKIEILSLDDIGFEGRKAGSDRHIAA